MSFAVSVRVGEEQVVLLGSFTKRKAENVIKALDDNNWLLDGSDSISFLLISFLLISGAEVDISSAISIEEGHDLLRHLNAPKK